MVKLYERERTDFIAGTTMPIIQSPDVFSYAIDAVLLGRFVRVPIQTGLLLDLCSGNGVVGLVLATRTKGQITLLELQERLHNMAERAIEANQLELRVTPICGDVKNITTFVDRGSYDVVTCNPPYFSVRDQSYIKEKHAQALARHELACTLEDVIRAGCFALKYGGKFALVHRPERLGEIFALMRAHQLEPKRIRFCHPHIDCEANMVFVEAIKGGKPGLCCLAPLIVYDEHGQYTKVFCQEYLCKTNT